VDLYRPGVVGIGAAVDAYFHEPLWLRTPCSGHELWAYNEQHLAFIKEYVSAELRGSYRDTQYGYSNQSLASRLPTWMKSAKNRDAVVAAVARLQERL
jgi:hypothetical protein